MKKFITQLLLFCIVAAALLYWANDVMQQEKLSDYEKLAVKAAFIQQVTGKEITPEQAEWVNISMVLTDISLNADNLDIFLSNGRKRK